jgi:hypothetical protein
MSSCSVLASLVERIKRMVPGRTPRYAAWQLGSAMQRLEMQIGISEATISKCKIPPCV